MSSLSAEEVRHRLAALADGPWREGVAKARRVFAPIDAIKAPTRATQPIALQALKLSTANQRKNGRLAILLRAHWEDPDGVTNPLEIEKRNALDDALTLPQLYELAVQTGYLPAEAVRGPARALFMDLLWSDAARRFVHLYDYVAVPLLASRVDVLGFGSAEPPQPNERAALRFAAFLAQLREFYADQEIAGWTAFLDDFGKPEEREWLWRYLRGESATGPACTARLLAGCTRFVTSLASALYILDDEEQGRFGLIHAYWLQKFLGYERDEDGVYVKDDHLWDPGDSWAHTVQTSPHLLAGGTTRRVARILHRQFRDDVRVLRRTFEAVRRLSKAARGRKTVPM